MWKLCYRHDDLVFMLGCKFVIFVDFMNVIFSFEIYCDQFVLETVKMNCIVQGGLAVRSRNLRKVVLVWREKRLEKKKGTNVWR